MKKLCEFLGSLLIFPDELRDNQKPSHLEINERFNDYQKHSIREILI